MEKSNLEIKKLESITPEYLKMYEISGQNSITEHSFKRYIKDKNQDNLIREQIENAPPLKEKKFSPKQNLNHITEVQREFAEMVTSAPEKERTSLIKLGLENSNIDIQKTSVKMIEFAPEEDKASLIKLGVENKNVEIQKISTGMFWLLSDEEKDSFKKDLVEKVKEGLENPNVEIQKAYIGMIGDLPYKGRSVFVKQCLENQNFEIQKAAASIMGLVPEEERTSLIKLGLENPSIEIQKISVRMIENALYKERGYLINLCLENPNIEIQNAAVGILRSVPDEDAVNLKIKILEKVKRGIENHNVDIQKAYVKMLWAVPEENKKELINLLIEKGLGEELIKSPLYDNKKIDEKTFSRQEFEKTGSGLTLIGGELKDKTIIRHIKPEAFMTWQKLYEDYAEWKEASFDYVPIEPIQSYKLNKEGLVDVYSGVLDLNLSDWADKTEIFVDELREQKDKIIKVLNKLKIKHGHSHERNFCLRFFRDEKENVDFKRVPRLYMIDFDLAVSSPNQLVVTN